MEIRPSVFSCKMESSPRLCKRGPILDGRSCRALQLYGMARCHYAEKMEITGADGKSSGEQHYARGVCGVDYILFKLKRRRRCGFRCIYVCQPIEGSQKLESLVIR